MRSHQRIVPLRGGKYKLIRQWFGGANGEHKYELFDRSADVGGSENLAEPRHPERCSLYPNREKPWSISAALTLS